MYDEHDKELVERAKHTIWENITFADEAHSLEAYNEIKYICLCKYHRDED